MNLVSSYLSYIDYPDHERCSEKCDWVYLFRNPITKLFKIGITNSLKDRYQQIRSASGMDVEMIIAIQLEVDYDESPKVIERFLHKYFKHKRKIGEWFNLDLSDTTEIIELFYEIYGNDIVENESIDYYQKQVPTHKD